jgi:GH25 family lysozyme M1 (1,4-beta-N-acetylmuramidase)
MKRFFKAKNIILILALTCIAVLCVSCSKKCSHEDFASTVIQPTCDKEGYTLNECNDCSAEFKTDIVPPPGHAIGTTKISPDCDRQGYDLNLCSVCGFEYKSNYVAPLGHVLSVEQTHATCNAEGYKHAKCTVCDYEYIYDVEAPTGHDFEATIAHVTCLKQTGSTTYACECGFTYVGDYRFYSDIYKGAYVENTSVLAKGVDTSKWNHNTNSDGSFAALDWEKIKAAGIDYAILRAGYIGVPDPVFETDYTAARAAGLELGAYFYSYADTVEEAREEAEYCLTLLAGKQFEYPIYFDIEDDRLEGLDKDTLTAICIEFISVLQENGYYSALYTNNKWLTTLLHTDQITTLFDIWYSNPASRTEIVNEAVWDPDKHGKQMAMFQFSFTGTIDGIIRDDGKTPTSFDLNYCYKDYPTLIKELGLNGF